MISKCPRCGSVFKLASGRCLSCGYSPDGYPPMPLL